MIQQKLISHSDYNLLTWNELRIGDIYYHVHSEDFNIKTGNNSYFDISDHEFHTWPKLLQESHDKNHCFIRASYEMGIFLNYHVVPDYKDFWRLEHD